MKLYFKKKDTIYKIFSTIEKVPNGKKIEIEIEEGNQFYDNNWWLKQLVKVLDKNLIEYTFICTRNTKKYFENEKINCKIKNDIFYILKEIFKTFLKTITSLHKNVFAQKKILPKIIILIEISFLIGLFYYFYKFISFHAEVYIRPSYNIETIIYNFIYYPKEKKYKGDKLAIPYYIGSGLFKYELSKVVEDLKYNTKQSHGKIEIYNYTNKDLSFRANTKFITKNGILFKSPTWFRLPPAKSKHEPSKIVLKIVSLEKDINGNPIGKSGNIPEGTKLYILKYNDSIKNKLIEAIAIQDFTGGKSIPIGTVTQEDINILKEKLKKEGEKAKIPLAKKILKENYTSDDILIDFKDLIKIEPIKIIIDSKPGEKKKEIKGIYEGKIYFNYIKFTDFVKAVKNYLKQRYIETLKLIEIKKDSIVFLNKVDLENGFFVITNQFDIIRGYDFKKDLNNIIPEIKNKILGKTKQKAENIILSYPEISTVEIKIYPIWYNILPKLKSQIKINVVE